VEQRYLGLVVMRGPRICRIERFEPEDVDPARARLRELGGSNGGAPENEAVRALGRQAEAFARRDWDQLAALYHADVQSISRRRMLAHATAVGRDAVVDAVRVGADVGATSITHTSLATRGDRLALARTVHSGATGFEIEVVTMCEVDGDGLIKTLVSFDPVDFDAAIIELDERFATGEGAAFAEGVRTASAVFRAIAETDYEALAALVAEDVVVVDHRLASHGEMRGRGRLVEWTRSFDEVVERAHSYVESYVALRPGACVLQIVNVGTTATGAEVDVSQCLVGVVRDGRVVRVERFERERVADALARFAELEDAPSEPTNACVRAHLAQLDDFFAGRWDAVAGRYEEDVLAEDRRPGIRTQRRGRTMRVDELRVLSEIGVTQIRSTTLALRGDRLALVGLQLSGDDAASYHVETIALYEVNESGLFVRVVLFEPSQIGDALVELADRFVAGEGAPRAEVLGLHARVEHCMNTRAFDELARLLTPDFTVVDHRRVSLGTMTGDAWVDSWRTFAEVAPDVAAVTLCYIALEEDRFVAEVHNVSTAHTGGLVDTPLFAVVAVSHNRMRSLDIYSIEERDAALARFEALGPSAVGPLIENAASRAMDRVLNAVRRQAWDDVGACISGDFSYESRRRGLQHAFSGVDAAVGGWQRVLESFGGDASIASRPLSVMRDDAALVRVRYTRSDEEAGAFSSEVLFAAHVNRDAEIDWVVQFDGDDFAGAMRLAAERFLGAVVVQSGVDIVAAINDGDWAAVRACVTDDHVVVDHRPASLGEIHGAEAYVDAVRALMGLGDFKACPAKLVAAARDRQLGLMSIFGRTKDGSDVEWSFYSLSQFRDGRTARQEWFPLDQLDRAHARFDELGRHDTPDAFVMERYEHAFEQSRDIVTSPVSERLENAVTRVAVRYSQAFAASDWDAMEQMQAVDSVWDDRRPGLRSVIRGRAERRKNIEAIAGVGAQRLVYAPVAVRGERIALLRAEATSGDFRSESLMVAEVDDKERIAATVLFALDDADAAFTELDERYAAAAGAGLADVVRLGSSFLERANVRDWPGARALLSDDFVLLDRRPASLGTQSGDAWIESVRVLSDVMPDMRARYLRYLALDENASLVDCVVGTHATDDTNVEVANLAIIRRRGDRIASMELYPHDGEADALARFDEVACVDGSAEPRSAGPVVGENACTRGEAAFTNAFNRRDWDAFGATWSADATRQDHRAGLGVRLEGRDAIVENFRHLSDLGMNRIEEEPLATFGEHLAIYHPQVTGHEGYEAEWLTVIEIDDDGQYCRSDHFDGTDFDGAFHELYERYLAGDGAPFAAAARPNLEFAERYNARDWDGLRSLTAPGFVFVDHRPVSWGRIDGIDAFVDALKTHVELAPDVRHEITWLPTVGEHGVVAALWVRGTTTDGVHTEVRSFFVGAVRDGLISEMHRYAEDQLDAAKTFLEELHAAPKRRPENMCTRRSELGVDAYGRGDLAAFAELWAADAVREDRRAGLGLRVEGRDAIVQNFAELRDLGLTRWRLDPLAIRGDDLALFRAYFTDRDGNEVEYLTVGQADAAGRYVRSVHFDSNDYATAFDELERRYALAAPPLHDVWKVGTRFIRALNDRDWDRWRSGVTDDFVYVDHQPAGVGALEGPDAYLRSVRTLLDMLPEYFFAVVDTFTLTKDGGVFRLWEHGADDQGNVVEYEYATVAVVRDGLFARAENFPIERSDDALARFAALTDQTPLATALRAYEGAFARRDWDALGALFADDAVLDDRRPAIGRRAEGREAVIVGVRGLADLGIDRVRGEVVATRGDRLGLMETTFTDAASNEIVALSVAELDAQARNARLVHFDANDVDAAFDELDARYIATAGEPKSTRLRELARSLDALNRGDWDAVRRDLADDLVFVDHRPASLEESTGADRRVAEIRALAELMNTYRWRVASFEASATAMLFEQRVTGETNEGTRVELVYNVVVQMRDHLVARMEVFAPDAAAAARRRFEELSVADGDPLVDVCARAIAAMNARDWTMLRELLDENLVLVDHRPVSLGTLTGREAWIDSIRAIREVSPDRHTRIVAVYAAVRDVIVLEDISAGTSSDGGLVEQPTLWLAQVRDGRATRIEVFTTDRLDDALSRFRELTSRTE
jgi:ketosteroid isomerase-like protein